jgi:hypothetical protein
MSLCYRIDERKIINFKKLGIYTHSKDWSHSKRVNPKMRQTVSLYRHKGLFAGKINDVAPFAVPRDVRWTHHLGDNGKPIISFDKKDRFKVKKQRSVLSVFNSRNFKKLPSGEMFSKLTTTPLRQKVISNTIQFIKNNGYIIQFVDDIKLYKQQLKDKIKNNPNFWVNSEGL